MSRTVSLTLPREPDESLADFIRRAAEVAKIADLPVVALQNRQKITAALLLLRE